jgi:hypothetical protein
VNRETNGIRTHQYGGVHAVSTRSTILSDAVLKLPNVTGSVGYELSRLRVRDSYLLPYP